MDPIRTRRLLPLLLAALVACGGDSDANGEARRVPEPGDASPSPVTAARYLTEVAFVPFDREAGPAAYLRLAQDVTAGRLALDYRGWRRDADGWSRLLSAADTLPVPRAGWRVLPAGPLRVVAGDGGRLGALTVRGAAGPLRLEPDSALADWTGPTGQRERLLDGRRVGPDATAAGLVVERRRARPLEAPLQGRHSGFLLLTTGEGDGLLVLLQAPSDPGATRPDSATVAYGRLDGTVGAWNRVRLDAAASGDDGRTRAWRLVLPRVQLQGRLEQVGAAAPGPAAAGGGVPGGGGGTLLRWVQGTLRLAGRSVPTSGLHVETGAP